MATVFPVRAIVGYRDGIPMWISVEPTPALTDQLYAHLVATGKFKPATLSDGTTAYRLAEGSSGHIIYNGSWQSCPSFVIMLAPGDYVALRFVDADCRIIGQAPHLPCADTGYVPRTNVPPKPAAPVRPRGPGLMQTLIARLKAVACYDDATVKAKKEERDNAPRFK